ncbi:hypothetical protein HK099_005810 [Clydaea vesicula]|uniref:Uncharacterized protein n=1 Tax=Clydaea vesicula TaxID=447962 RepID=A0AAD5U680_9FUNG|nr:hypothetical protein HK099_005810 [Clydaea vesicula]
MDKTIRMWAIKNAKALKVFKGHVGGVECLQVANNHIFSGSYDKTIRIFCIASEECIQVLSGHTDGIYCLKVFNNFLFSGSGDKSIRVWDIKSVVANKKKYPWWKETALCC